MSVTQIWPSEVLHGLVFQLLHRSHSKLALGHTLLGTGNLPGHSCHRGVGRIVHKYNTRFSVRF